jgi:hypothetical protein
VFLLIRATASFKTNSPLNSQFLRGALLSAGGRMNRLRLVNTVLVSGLFLTVIALCLSASFRFISIESTATLLLFNFLFIFLTFGLNGSLSRKIGVLTIGNVIGLFWNFMLYFFVIAGSAYFGEMFNFVYAIFRPFLNFMWIVSFWSLSLAAFPKPENLQMEAEP